MVFRTPRALLAAGCEDGTVRLFTTLPRGYSGASEASSDDAGALEYMRSVGPLGARVSSIAWGRVEPDEHSITGYRGYLFAGTDDATIHRIDMSTGEART